jgi:L-threonylcarbamoyladenylate synthase
MKNNLNRQAAIRALIENKVIIYPTEAVWGMGCDPQSQTAVEHLLTIKQRPVEKGLILIASSFEQVEKYVDMTKLLPDTKQQVFDSWPGPVTWLLPCSKLAPHWITGGSELIALRVTEHPTVISLCDGFDGAIVSTSANLTGQPTFQNLDQLQSVFSEQVAVYVDEPLGGNTNPSTIKHAFTGTVVRN